MESYKLILSFIAKRFLFALLLLTTKFSFSQTVVYSEPFNTTLAASGWTVTDLTVPWTNTTYFGLFWNNWYVNDAESGMPVNTCGAASMGNHSLYIGAVGLGALGAAYISNARTNRRIQSPIINTTGYTNMTLSFDFIGNGEANDDKAYLQYSVDGGANWINATGAPTSSNPALPGGSNLNNLKSQICGSGQGRWTNITWDLPAACENIPNLRIAFVWQNDNDATATDPAFAVNDISITVPTVLPVELLSFTGIHHEQENKLFWQTASESNNAFFSVEHSIDGIYFSELVKISGAGNSNQLLNYSFIHSSPQQGLNYYRLAQTDYDGTTKYSSVLALRSEHSENFNLINSFYNADQHQIELTLNCKNDCELNLELIDLSGRIIISTPLFSEGQGSKTTIPLPSIANGFYLLKIYNGKELIAKKMRL